MFFFFHLFTGIVLGLLIGDLLHDRRWVIPLVIGAVLPDLIDKPIGYLIFADVFGNGRIFMHGLLVFCAFFIIGFIIWKRWVNPAMLAFALGILSHQVLDRMWEDPTTWYFPLLGPFRYSHGGDYAFVLLQSDFSVGSEWILAIAIVIAIIIYLASKRYGNIILRYRNIWMKLLETGAFVFCLLAGIAIGSGLSPVKGLLLSPFRFLNWTDPADCIIGGIVFALCAYVLWNLRSGLMKNEKILSVK